MATPRLNGNGRNGGSFDLSGRVSRLEQGFANLTTDVDRLVTAVETQTTSTNVRLDGISREVLTARVPNLTVWIGAASLVLILFAAGTTPLWLSLSYVREETQATSKWQQEYTKGQIPSSATGEIAGMRLEFRGAIDAQRERDKEQETQFKHAAEEIAELKQAEKDAQKADLESAVTRARLDERMKVLEERRK